MPDDIDDALLPLLPPDVLTAIHAWAPSVIAALVLITALVHALLPIARWAERQAIKSARKWDDGPARRTVEVLAWLADATSAALAWMPRIAVGPARARLPMLPTDPAHEARVDALIAARGRVRVVPREVTRAAAARELAERLEDDDDDPADETRSS